MCAFVDKTESTCRYNNYTFLQKSVFVGSRSNLKGLHMKTKTFLGLVLSLLLSSQVMAQSNPTGQADEQGSRVTRVTRGSEGGQVLQRGHSRPARPSAQSVPELDGNMAFLALGLMFAVGALVREKRRTN
jgi:hypothetical protein